MYQKQVWKRRDFGAKKGVSVTRKHFFLILQVFFLFFFLIPSLSAEKVKILTWQDLVPNHQLLENPLQNLDLGLRLNLEYIAIARFQFRLGQITEVDPDYEYALELEHKLKSRNIDVEFLVAKFDAFLDKVERLNKSVVQDLNTKLVRIPGYALPLESSTAALEEFFLVPTVGACIHTPVPPANQMVFVKVSEPYYAKKLFEPVWVTGRMKLEYGESSIQYSDGEGSVESAYTIQEASVENYTD